ncbi:MAG: Sensor histidine kinase [Chloroflexi bacterium]|nr:Sensor histidine kinase [Chloroflexota bacterium]
MSIRLRLTLLYSVILVITLAALGLAIYASVSQVTFGLVKSSLTTEARNLSATLQPHLDPDRGNAISILPPTRDPGSLTSVQVRDLHGAIVYQSSDLRDAHYSLPLDASLHQPMQMGTVSCNTSPVKGNQLLICNVVLLRRPIPAPQLPRTGSPQHPGSPQQQPGFPQQQGAATAFGVIQVARSLADVNGTLNTLRQALLLGGLVATVLAFGAGWLLAGTALRPIRRMTQSAQTIGEVQDFGRRVSYHGPRDEVGRLATTLNGMLARLQEAYQTQRRFAADASHELRTPLTSIRGNLGLLQREPPIAEVDRVAVLADLVSESERLSRLVSDLLLLARSDAGRQLRHGPVPLEPVLADLTRLLAVSYPARTVRVGDHPDVTVVGDPDALTQVLLILLDNALKFTLADDMVHVDVTTDSHLVSIAIRDTGPGIAPDVLPHIFDRFFQGDAARAGTGTGLGLAIARALVEGQHGTLTVFSEVGRGSTFTVTLPRARADAHLPASTRPIGSA